MFIILQNQNVEFTYLNNIHIFNGNRINETSCTFQCVLVVYFGYARGRDA